uniref:V-type proton ATPase subunit a n=1 Tax=Trieres chinensis TaxID=1514140 RepID=A0A7S1Z1A5_TRICV|eukprot:CAMPEP_0183291984 /NCGR_PEP_ID=MMETSP0160_2-20130417/1219_1 /TAXON_ID=2839 ORGANISM="Odontella Sinensis, Strain Grunow 1884" /NCGR_SAMPLE_ID=MMETSP0160_2 /ASSEMBLY_ACC=CAM_ASM_000250 /LENGTH=877 /DNA_ID=CAMNT_0025452875 /DNA_START=65 /DNA_END=2698 /DNA_ORIENTATION=-
MARWFRSEEMEYISLIVNEDAAHDCLADLGKMGVIQFTDLNPDLTPFQRRYVTYVKRCDELERKIRFFANACDSFNLSLQSAGDIGEFLETPTTASSGGGKSETGGALLESLEVELEGYEGQLKELNSYSEKLTTEYNEKVELQEVLEKARRFFMTDAPRLAVSELTTGGPGGDRTESLLEAEGGPSGRDMDMRFSSITGVVSTEEKVRFERMIFRATRGNCYVRFAPIKQPITDPETGNLVEKCVFIVFYKSLSIETKLKNICDAFGAHRYSLPDMDDAPAVDRMLTENAQELVDSRTVLLKNQDTRFRLCQMLAQHCERWTWIVLREKAIYHSLNMFKADVSGMLRGEGWVIASAVDACKDAVERAHANMSNMPSLVDHVPKPWPTPPTHFTTNKFTYGYQEFVNTYGIPRYREANPALFTAATFPFLFGVMYGDIGHGLFLFCAGLYLLWNEKANDKEKLGEMTAGLHAGRYMITMMGFFAVYAGLIYNDCFSLGLNLFGSKYIFEGQYDGEVEEGTEANLAGSYGDPSVVYPMGLDPAWKVASNELLFFNSFKMKISVIFGIIQMFSGTLLKGINAIYFGEKLDFLFEFLPMVAFAVSLFMYMVVLIVMKWSINWNSRMLSATCLEVGSEGWGSSDYEGVWAENCEGDYCTPWGYVCQDGDDTVAKCPLDFGGSGDGCQPPNLITTLINIALNPGEVDEPMYAGQATIQNYLLIIAFVSVPILLLAKPYFLSKQMESHGHGHGDDEEHDEDHGFGEIVIHQAIETIEFVLGMVSNTASYLRLWALSLAHSELATVFWEKAMLSTLNINWFATYIGFGIFAGVTCGVLLMMDVLECFLHALRLHWVEFQNKFFAADGIRFAPYSFKQVLTDATA